MNSERVNYLQPCVYRVAGYFCEPIKFNAVWLQMLIFSFLRFEHHTTGQHDCAPVVGHRMSVINVRYFLSAVWCLHVLQWTVHVLDTCSHGWHIAKEPQNKSCKEEGHLASAPTWSGNEASDSLHTSIVNWTATKMQSSIFSIL